MLEQTAVLVKRQNEWVLVTDDDESVTHMPHIRKQAIDTRPKLFPREQDTERQHLASRLRIVPFTKWKPVFFRKGLIFSQLPVERSSMT